MNDAEGRIIERDRTPWVNRVTHDAIQHFAWGIGDDNPRWIAPGRQIAPPCFLYAVDETTVAPGLDDHRRIYRSVEWTWFDRAPAGTELAATATLIDESTTPSGELEQLGRVDFHNADGELIASAQTRCVRTRAPEPAVGDRPELRYRAEELDQIETTILRERRQGATPRYWEDVAVGDRFGPLLKGPLSIMDVVAWCAGTQGVAGDAFGLSEGGLHSETATGPQQVAWVGQLITDWMGDEAFLHGLEVDIEANPPLGATTALVGQITERRVEDGVPGVIVRVTATDQGGVTTATATALVILPSRTYGNPDLPMVPIGSAPNR